MPKKNILPLPRPTLRQVETLQAELRILERRSPYLDRSFDGRSLGRRSASPLPLHRTSGSFTGRGRSVIVPSLVADPRSSWPQRSSSPAEGVRLSAIGASSGHSVRRHRLRERGGSQQRRRRGFDVDSDGSVAEHGDAAGLEAEAAAHEAASEVRCIRMRRNGDPPSSLEIV